MIERPLDARIRSIRVAVRKRQPLQQRIDLVRARYRAAKKPGTISRGEQA